MSVISLRNVGLSKLMERLNESWQNLPDYHKPNNNTRYSISDAALAAFLVFFMHGLSTQGHGRYGFFMLTTRVITLYWYYSMTL